LEDTSLATRFSKPPDYKEDGYDENKGSLWRVRVPLGTVRKVILDDGAALAVRSNNPQVILNSKLDEVTVNGGVMLVFSLFGNSPGVSMLEARDGTGAVRAFVQVAAVDDLVEVQSTDPSKQADYIDQRLVAVGYSIYLGGCHVYCDNLKLPVFLPNSEINFTLASARSVGDTVHADRAAALKAAAAGPKAAGGASPVAYYRAVGGALIAPTVFSPATTPRTIQTLRTAMTVLADDVKNQMIVLVGTLVGTAVLKMLATRVVRWSQGGPEPTPSPPPRPQLHPSEERLLNTQQNLQNKQVIRSGKVLTEPAVFRHDLTADNPLASFARIEKEGAMRLSTGAKAHYGEGVYAWTLDKRAVGPCIDVEVPAGTAVETLTVDGKTWVRLVPATGDRLPVKIVNTNLTEQQKQMGRIMARD
jgi:hypothetical protein